MNNQNSGSSKALDSNSTQSNRRPRNILFEALHPQLPPPLLQPSNVAVTGSSSRRDDLANSIDRLLMSSASSSLNSEHSSSWQGPLAMNLDMICDERDDSFSSIPNQVSFPTRSGSSSQGGRARDLNDIQRSQRIFNVLNAALRLVEDDLIDEDEEDDFP